MNKAGRVYICKPSIYKNELDRANIIWWKTASMLLDEWNVAGYFLQNSHDRKTVKCVFNAVSPFLYKFKYFSFFIHWNPPSNIIKERMHKTTTNVFVCSCFFNVRSIRFFKESKFLNSWWSGCDWLLLLILLLCCVVLCCVVLCSVFVDMFDARLHVGRGAS